MREKKAEALIVECWLGREKVFDSLGARSLQPSQKSALLGKLREWVIESRINQLGDIMGGLIGLLLVVIAVVLYFKLR